jgi:hypothetical protein
MILFILLLLLLFSSHFENFIIINDYIQCSLENKCPNGYLCDENNICIKDIKIL